MPPFLNYSKVDPASVGTMQDGERKQAMGDYDSYAP